MSNTILRIDEHGRTAGNALIHPSDPGSYGALLHVGQEVHYRDHYDEEHAGQIVSIGTLIHTPGNGRAKYITVQIRHLTTRVA